MARPKRRAGRPRKGAAASGGSLRHRATRGIEAARRVVLWSIAAMAVGLVAWVAAYRWIDPPTTPYIAAEVRRLEGVDLVWTDLEDVAPIMVRAVVAAEDADFCRHWGFDLDAIRSAIEDGGGRGASTITQQVVKNAFLWQGRSWPRKALEAALTPLVELLWPKRRILEVYLNVAEMGEGVFGVGAASRAHFWTDPAGLSPAQAARLASILPNPKVRDPANPTPAMARKAGRVLDGAATIRADGRAACFED